jgi:hypothetical protein
MGNLRNRPKSGIALPDGQRLFGFPAVRLQIPGNRREIRRKSPDETFFVHPFDASGGSASMLA